MKTIHPGIVQFQGKNLAGIRATMTYSANTTPQLWRNFMPPESEEDIWIPVKPKT
jgi:hypothetical protein